ncbi:MAG: sulfurtransferase [Pseudomonadota bacterium]
MTYTTLISAPELRELLEPGTPVVVLDTRFELNDSEAGEAAYRQGHVPGAHYLHLDRDLSGPKTGRNGRHPLPDPAAWSQTAGARGVTRSSQVVVYDHHQGMFAARAWWMVRQLGVDSVAVLDGGLDAWLQAGGPLTQDIPELLAPDSTTLRVGAWRDTVQADELLAGLDQRFILDARAPERYRGDVEPLDRVAGHIPGARNRFFKHNLDADGRFKPADVLRSEFLAQLGDAPVAEVVHQCGSGATACHNLLAMEVAGLTRSKLYPGSWSEWCSDPERPVGRG